MATKAVPKLHHIEIVIRSLNVNYVKEIEMSSKLEENGTRCD